MKNNLIQKILNNVNDIIEIRKLAQNEFVSYGVAKIMYNGGKNDIDYEDALEIYNASKDIKVPYNIVQDIVLNGEYKDLVKYDDVNKKVYEDYIKGKYKEIDDSNFGSFYVDEILDFVAMGYSVEKADRLLRKKIDLYVKKHNISKMAATFAVICNLTDKGALRYEEVINYHFKNKLDISDSMINNVRKYIELSNEFKKKKVHGITIISKTDRGLNRMETIINRAFEKGNDNYKRALFKQSRMNSLIITDFSYSRVSTQYFESNIIYMNDDDRTLDEAVDTFYHETSHYLDDVLSPSSKYKCYSEANIKVREIFEKIRSSVVNSSIESISNNKNIPLCIRNFVRKANYKFDIALNIKGFRYRFFRKKMSDDYIHNEKLNVKWKKEVDEEFNYYDAEQRKALYRQKLNYEAKKYRILIDSILDIYDGLAKGKLYDRYKIPGHGSKYYSRKNSDLLEFVATLGEIYNFDGKDLLEYEFGTELANEMLQIYEDMINNNSNITKNYINGMKVIRFGRKERTSKKDKIIEGLKNIRDDLAINGNSSKKSR